MIGSIRSDLVASLSGAFPSWLVEALLAEFQEIRTSFALGRFGPSELRGGRFAECVVRCFEHLLGDPITPLGQPINSSRTINKISNSPRGLLPESVHIFMPPLVRVLMDVRNRRDVAHVGGEVSPNYPDSLLVIQNSDWILTELIRCYTSSSVEEAKKQVELINDTRIPLIEEINGRPRVLNPNMDIHDQVIVILYHYNPNPISDTKLAEFTYTSDMSRFKSGVLYRLHSGGYKNVPMIDYTGGECVILRTGIQYAEANISFDLPSR